MMLETENMYAIPYCYKILHSCYDVTSEFSNAIKTNEQKNEKLRNTLVSVHLDGIHMCILVISKKFVRYAFCIACTYAYKT